MRGNNHCVFWNWRCNKEEYDQLCKGNGLHFKWRLWNLQGCAINKRKRHSYWMSWRKKLSLQDDFRIIVFLMHLPDPERDIQKVQNLKKSMIVCETVQKLGSLFLNSLMPYSLMASSSRMTLAYLNSSFFSWPRSCFHPEESVRLSWEEKNAIVSQYEESYNFFHIEH